jgi:hypothetical protein
MFEFSGDRGRKAAVVARCAAASLVLAATTLCAQAYSARVNSACENDYYRLCSAYAVGSTSLSRCMEASRRVLTPRCVDALVAEGLVPRKYLTKR